MVSWLLVYAEMLISPIGLSVTTRLAPKAFRSQMMSLWFLADATGQAINSQIVKYYSSKTEVAYFLAVGIVSVLFGVVRFFFTYIFDNHPVRIDAVIFFQHIGDSLGSFL